jgi:DNA-binding protein HU-beta
MSDNLSKKELVEKVSKRLELDPKLVDTVTECMWDEIYKSIKQGRSLMIKDSGTFYVKRTSSTWVFKFSPSQKWRMMLGWSSTYKGKLS